MEINNKKKAVQNRHITKKGLLVRQELWNIVFEEEKISFGKVYKYLRTRYPFRLADGLIILGIFGFYGMCIAFWKNYYFDALRTTKPYKMTLQPWAFFPYMYQRQPKEPFLYLPKESEIRDREMYEQYNTNKENLMFKKQQQYDVNLRGEGERITPAQDHREYDNSEFLTLIKMNFDIMSLNMLKRSINQEMVKLGVYNDHKIYLKERLAMEYKASDYMFKDDLYKELNDLLDI